LQIEAARDLQMIKSSRVIRTLFNVEKFIINRADTVSSISEGMIEKIRSKAGKDITFFPNWVDTRVFHPLENRAELKEEFGFKADDKIILYSGAIGEKQGLEAIIHTAGKLKDKKGLKFLICGSGPYKEKLKALVTELDLDNVIFFPLQPFEKFNKFLNLADVHLVIQKAMASDLVMPSKLTTILAVGGLALITANSGSSLYKLVDSHKMGLLVQAENQEALTEGVELSIIGNQESIHTNARKYAEENLSIDSVLGRYIGTV
jgi:colanic acid biosynthesis glycosyl transferase WcaI